MENKNITMKNRSDTTVGYKIPRTRIVRTLAPSETITDVTMEELQDLLFSKGGPVLLREYLLIEQSVAEELGLDLAPEYWLSEEKIISLLRSNKSTLLKDCLVYAPTGVRDLIKKIAVEEKVSLSYEQKEVINAELKINLDSMIKNNRLILEDAAVKAEPETNRNYSFLEDDTEPTKETTKTKYTIV